MTQQVPQAPPHDLDLERNVITACVYAGEYARAFAAGLRVEAFYSGTLAEIFKACERLAKAGEPIDAVSVNGAISPTLSREHRKHVQDHVLAMVDWEWSSAGIPSKVSRLMGLAACREMMRAWLECCEEEQTSDEGTWDHRRLSSRLMGIAERALQEGGRPLQSFAEVYESACARAERFATGRGSIPTAFEDLDRLMGVMRAGYVYGLAGHEKSGKTQVLLDNVRRASAAGIKSGIISLEMRNEDLAERYLGRASEKVAHMTRGGDYTGWRGEFEHARFALGTDLDNTYFFRDSKADLDSVLGKVQTAATYGCKFIAIDYLNLIRKLRGYGNATEQLNEVSRALTEIAAHTETALLVLTQYNREAYKREDKRPRPEDCYGGSALARDGGGLLLLDTPWSYDKSADKAYARLNLARNRFGPTGEIALERTSVGNFVSLGVDYDTVMQ